MNIIYILILLLIYLIGTTNIKKEYFVTTPSELEITFCEDFSHYENNSDIIVSKHTYNNNNYFKHYNPVINIKNIHFHEYKNFKINCFMHF